jgi:hypothetical protein
MHWWQGRAWWEWLAIAGFIGIVIIPGFDNQEIHEGQMCGGQSHYKYVFVGVLSCEPDCSPEDVIAFLERPDDGEATLRFALCTMDEEEDDWRSVPAPYPKKS